MREDELVAASPIPFHPTPLLWKGFSGLRGIWSCGQEALHHSFSSRGGREGAQAAQCLAFQGSAVPGSCLTPSSSDSTKGWSHLQSPEFLVIPVVSALRETLLPLGPQTQLN